MSDTNDGNALNNNIINAYIKDNGLPVAIATMLTKMKTFYEGKDKELNYHNMKHMEDVVNRVWFLYHMNGYENEITQQELVCLLFAAIFHDVGYVLGADASTHEEKSVIFLMENYESYFIPKSALPMVSRYIMATKIDTEAKDLAEKLIKDADILHWTFDYNSFAKTTIDVRSELKYDSYYHLFLRGTIDRFMSKYHFQGLNFEAYNAHKELNIIIMENIIKLINNEKSIFTDVEYDLIDKYLLDIDAELFLEDEKAEKKRLLQEKKDKYNKKLYGKRGKR